MPPLCPRCPHHPELEWDAIVEAWWCLFCRSHFDDDSAAASSRVLAGVA